MGTPCQTLCHQGNQGGQPHPARSTEEDQATRPLAPSARATSQTPIRRPTIGGASLIRPVRDSHDVTTCLTRSRPDPISDIQLPIHASTHAHPRLDQEVRSMWSSVYRQTGKAGGGRKARGLDATRTSGNARLGPPRPQNRDTPEIATKPVDSTPIQHICEHRPIRNDHRPPCGTVHSHRTEQNLPSLRGSPARLAPPEEPGIIPSTRKTQQSGSPQSVWPHGPMR